MQWYRMFDSYMDILIIAVVALIIFGGTKKIPEMARNLGKASDKNYIPEPEKRAFLKGAGLSIAALMIGGLSMT